MNNLNGHNPPAAYLDECREEHPVRCNTCHHCKCDELTEFDYESKQLITREQAFRIACGCGCCGPWMLNIDDAVYHWNQVNHH